MRSVRCARAAAAVTLALAAPVVPAATPAAAAPPPDCSTTSVGLTPLNDLGAGTYRGVPGGLYPGGGDAPPQSHLDAGVARARTIGPLDVAGDPDPGGRYAFVSIGMSNTSQEFGAFMASAAPDVRRDPALALVNGAQGGQTADDWAVAGSEPWVELDRRLTQSGLTRDQVAAAWVKVANRNPTEGWPGYARDLRDDMAAIVSHLEARFPNLRIAYVASRIYAGYATTTLNPEPYAYESGFSAKWLVEDQIEGAPELNYDPARGPVNAPWLAWGPYLWADGTTPRSDGLTWECEDFGSDGTHPSPAGEAKVATMLLDFVRSDPTAAQWYLEIPPDAVVTTTIVSDRRATAYRARFALSGRVDAPASCPGPHSVSVVKQVAGGGRSTEIAAVETAPDGTWSLIHRSRRSATYTATAAGPQCESGTSPPVRVDVRVRIALDEPRCSTRGIAGGVRPDHPGTRVVLDRRRDGTWVAVDRDVLSPASAFRLDVRRCAGVLRVRWPEQAPDNSAGTVRLPG